MVTRAQQPPEEKEAKGIRSLTAYVSALLSRMSLASRAGLQFEGRRDLYKILGYKKIIYFEDMLARYERQDIAKRIVCAPSGATWRQPINLKGGAAFDAAWETMQDKLNVWPYMEKADRLLGMGQFSILLLGFDDGGDMKSPVMHAANLLYIHPYSEGSVAITAYDDNPFSDRFGLPTVYDVTIMNPQRTVFSSTLNAPALKTSTISVHWTRIIHLAEDTLEDTVFGIPRLASVYNLLDDMAKVVGGSAEAFWLIANRGMQADIDKEMELDKNDSDNLEAELEEYQHQLRRFIRTRGVKITPLGEGSPSPDQTYRMLISLISATTGIPQRVLMGSEAGQLASEQDRANWADRVEERRMNFGEPIVVRPFVARLVAVGLLPNPQGLGVEWSPAFTMSPLEEGQAAAQNARSVLNFSQSNMSGFPIVSSIEARRMLNLPDEVEGELPKPPAPKPGASVGSKPSGAAKPDIPVKANVESKLPPLQEAPPTRVNGVDNHE